MSHNVLRLLRLLLCIFATALSTLAVVLPLQRDKIASLFTRVPRESASACLTAGAGRTRGAELSVKTKEKLYNQFIQKVVFIQ